MAVTWTRHRFSGGALALDAANTVVMRGDAERMFDRFDDPAEIARFAEAATNFRAEELGGRALAVADPHEIAPAVLAIRETTDRLFRGVASEGSVATAALPDFLDACAAGLRGDGLSLRRESRSATRRRRSSWRRRWPSQRFR
jgi:predicted RNA-binding Zn ribbon-like protein